MTTTFVPGVRVAVRGEDFLIRQVKDFGKESEATEEGHLLYVEGLSELVKGQQFIFDTRIDREIHVLDPLNTELKADQEAGYRKLKLYLETQIRNAPVTSDKIAVAHKAAWDVTDYQLEPTLKAFGLPRPRMLIADGVGLGKTIEVGVFLAEMIRRGRGKRIMVLALKSILGQFQQEIWNRFAIPLMRLDSTGIDRIKAELPMNKNPFDYYDRTIVSIDTLKNNAKFRHYIEKSHWDIIVIDECHTVANKNSLRGDLASFLASKCESLVLTSATPHNGRRESFANLIRMIEPTAIPQAGDYTREDVAPYYVRRFKNDIVDLDVQSKFQDRQIMPRTAALHPIEEGILKVQQRMKLENLDGDRSRSGDLLFSISLFKGFLSSPAAMLGTVERRLNKMAERGVVDGPMVEDLKWLQSELRSAIAQRIDSKYDALKSLLEAMKWKGRKKDERIVVFSERVDTIRYLSERLQAEFGLKDNVIQKFDGSLSDTEQQAIVEDFGKEDSDIRLFISSDAGSQGVNLHYYCHRMVNYDIPWSLITLEQRNGRIDRYGQEKTPIIHYLVAQSDQPGLRTDLHIIKRLTEKEDEVHRTLGDAASVMKLYDSKKEEERVAELLISGLDEGEDEQEAERTYEWGDTFQAADVDLDLLFGGEADSTPAVEAAKDRPIAEGISLYASDSAYYQELVAQLKSDGLIRPDEVNFEDDTYFEVRRSDELDRILYDMPREAMPKERKYPFGLAFDKAIVSKSIADARKRKGEWAKNQIFYDLHPIARFYMTKLEASVDKAMALVAELTRLPYNTAWYVLHGQVANGRGQSVISDFFVVPIRYEKGGLAGAPMRLDDFIEAFRIHEPLQTLDITTDELATLERWLGDAVEFGTQMHMRPLQDEAKLRMERQLATYKQHLEVWAEDAERQLDLAFEDSTQNTFARHKLESGKREVETIVSESSQYYLNLLALDKDAYIRVVSVFFNNEK
jgi:superfamily II DNA or RNA helicase